MKEEIVRLQDVLRMDLDAKKLRSSCSRGSTVASDEGFTPGGKWKVEVKEGEVMPKQVKQLYNRVVVKKHFC